MSYLEEVVVRIESREKELNFSDELFLKLAERVENNLNDYVLSENSDEKSSKNYVAYSIDRTIYIGMSRTSELLEELFKDHGENYKIGIFSFFDYGFGFYSEFLGGKLIKNFRSGQVLVDLYPLESDTFMSSSNYLNYNVEDRSDNRFFKSADYLKVEEILEKYDFVDSESLENLLSTSEYLDYDIKISFINDLNLISDIIKPYGLSLAYSITCFDRDLNVEQIVKIDEKFEYRHMKFWK